MLFNSLDFAIFLPIVFLLYWFVAQKNLKLQNTLIVLASYIFYGWWDWRFLSLIIFSTVVDYLVGQKLRIEDFYDDTHLNEVGTKNLTIILNTKINSIIQNNKNLDT